MNSFKEECLALRKKGFSLNQISKATGRPKTSVYTHIKRIPLSEKRIAEIKINSRKRAIFLAKKRKGVSNRGFTEIKEWDERLSCLVGHLIFDGSITKSSCIYNNRNQNLIKEVEENMRVIYSYGPKYWLNQKTGVLRISYHNVALAKYLKEKSEKIILELPSQNIRTKRAFIKAFFDDEGSIDFRPNKNLRRVRGYQKNTQILRLIKELLKTFDISSTIVMPNEIVISGKDNLKKFQKEINFSRGVRLNGKRKNSIWKKPYEKNFLLETAIKSFK